jgi:hypothetical protein
MAAAGSVDTPRPTLEADRSTGGGRCVETETVLAKLRRLRYRTDYPLRLFLAAMRDRSCPDDTGIRRNEDTKSTRCAGTRSWPRRQPPGSAWRLWLGRCPCCGRLEREPGRRGARAN